MKILEYKNLEIEDFTKWYAYLYKQFSEVFGATWDKERKILKIFYEDTTTPLTLETLQKLKIPTVLKFKKKIIPPDLGIADTIVTATIENELTIETQQPQEIRKKIKEKYPEFEEV